MINMSRGLLLLAFMMIGCNGEAHLEARALSNGTVVNVEVVNVKSFLENGIQKSLVYGHLTFGDTNEISQRINLTCIEISTESSQSEAIYVDSVAHVLPDRYLLDKGKNKVAVYWKMNKVVELSALSKRFNVSMKDGCRLLLDS